MNKLREGVRKRWLSGEGGRRKKMTARRSSQPQRDESSYQGMGQRRKKEVVGQRGSISYKKRWARAHRSSELESLASAEWASTHQLQVAKKREGGSNVAEIVLLEKKHKQSEL